MAMQVYKVGSFRYRILFPELLRPLSASEREELKESIRQHGVQVPILIDASVTPMGVIDGGHRVTLAAELGLGFIPFVLAAGAVDMGLEQKRQLALAINHARRHLDPPDWSRLRDQRKGRVEAAARMRHEGKSTRDIAAATGVNQTQARADLKAATEQGCSVEPEGGKVKSADGRERPAKAGPKPPPPPPSHPYSDRIMRWLAMVSGEMDYIDLEMGGLPAILEDRREWDRRRMREAALPILDALEGRLKSFKNELNDAFTPLPPVKRAWCIDDDVSKIRELIDKLSDSWADEGDRAQVAHFLRQTANEVRQLQTPAPG